MTATIMTGWLTTAILGYFLLSRTGNFLLNLLAVFRLRDIEREDLLSDLPRLHAGLEQPISLLIATSDEASTIVSRIRTLLQLDYSTFEIIVVNDGSHDATMEELMHAFALHPFPEAYRIRLQTKPVRGIYRSTLHSNLRVIDKEKGGTADALNAGINAARYPLFCSVDDGLLLQRDCLQRLAVPFINETQTVAAIAAARIVDDVNAENVLPTSVALPRRWLSRLQIVDWLRTALFSPLGWSTCNAMLIAPAGLHLLRKDVVLDVGGYLSRASDPAGELIVRLHRLLRAGKTPYRMHLITEKVCARGVPDTLPAWKNERMQWQRGLADSLRLNRKWSLRNAGVAGWIAYPFTLLFEVWGPRIDIFSYVFMLVAFVCGLLPSSALIAFATVAIGFGMLLSVSVLLLEEMSFRTYSTGRDITMLAGAAVLLHLGYAQLEAAWRSLPARSLDSSGKE